MINNLHLIKEVSVLDVIARYAKIERGNFACCPIHNEKTSSLKIYTKTNTFKCFGCGAAGDAISFVQKMERWDFLQAVEEVAKVGGIELELSEADRESWKEQKEKQRNLQETLTWATSQYRLYLEQSEDAKAYLNKRGITEETIAKFQLGFAPNSWSYLTDMIMGSQTPEFATTIGLIKEKEKGGYFDMYRNRIIFPYLHHHSGEVQSLSGRIITTPENNTPKTIKGLNTALHNDDSFLYGYYQAAAAIKEMRYATIVEGEMDVLQMHQAGAINTIGKGNNRMKEPQFRFLKSQGIETLLFIPDNDLKDNGKNPGFDGFESDLKLALQFNFRVDILEIPQGQDPDDFAKQFVNN
jgi:DNA primase